MREIEFKMAQFLLTELHDSKISGYRQTISAYYPSNYFHVGPRYDMLGFLQRTIQKSETLKVAAF